MPPVEANPDWQGRVRIEPEVPAIAGQYGSWTVRYRVGASGIDEGGSLRLAWRSVSDWPTPQFTQPSMPNFASVRTSGNARLVPSTGRGGERPWSRIMTITIMEEALAPDEEVVIVLGDLSGGSPGLRAQTYPESPSRVKVDVDPFGTGRYESVGMLEIPIVGGRATRLYAVAPSDAVVGEPTWLQVRALDAWGNPDPNYDGTIRFSGDLPTGLPKSYRFTLQDAGVHRFEKLTFSDSQGPDVRRIVVSDHDRNLQATSNPARIHREPPDRQTFWADLHGQTEETVGSGTLDQYFAYARDIAAIDAAGHQGNDFQIDDALWQEICRQTEAFNEPGRFTTLHGYEWSGITSAGGDHNVYLKQPGPMHRSSHTQIDDTSDRDTDRYPITALHDEFKGNQDVMIIPHVGGRRADIQWHEPSLEPAIEIASQWGRFEWLAREALERDYRVAFIAGSDDHSGRQGWSAPTLAHHGVQGGLTALSMSELSREAVWEALKNRNAYGTTGPRILLDVTVDGNPMGSEIKIDQDPKIDVRVNAVAPIDTIELRRGTELLHRWSAMPDPETDRPVRLRIAWRGARNRGRSRALDWSGELRVWNGSITKAENYAIDTALDGIQQQEANRVVWSSHTCGDWDGVIIELDGSDDAQFDFVSPTMQFRFSLDDLKEEPLVHHGTGLEQQVIVQRLAHAQGPLDAAFSWTDHHPVPGMNPYWIWVTQSDGEMAWSTPVYAQIGQG